ncbi:7-carboxy-7-deazaguanine synthase QueE [Aquilutibacter rugosus]|uniref:7-carboxy-7-deazaguanine synthase QueE n=1 Tax=Aquilutibacter rugosus TaxID=3115820 RepID=UPI002F41A392
MESETCTPEPVSTDRLRLTEIFVSLQGEARTAGRVTTFVRLTGCPLRCQYCDTAYAFHGGEWWNFDAILDKVRELGAHHVCVTGGEPLAQKRARTLLTMLCDAGFDVSLETSGSLDVSAVDPRVSRIVDIKTPDSHESHRNLLSNLDVLTPHDQLKFVICSRADYEWSRAMLRDLQLDARCEVLFSPSFTQVDPTQLADWVVEDRLPVRFQFQLHKVLWNDEPGR